MLGVVEVLTDVELERRGDRRRTGLSRILEPVRISDGVDSKLVDSIPLRPDASEIIEVWRSDRIEPDDGAARKLFPLEEFPVLGERNTLSEIFDD